MIEDEYHKLFPGDDAASVWLRAKREEAIEQDDRFKSERWWSGLAESDRARWSATTGSGSVLEAWLAWRATTPLNQ